VVKTAEKAEQSDRFEHLDVLAKFDANYQYPDVLDLIYLISLGAWYSMSWWFHTKSVDPDYRLSLALAH
jgi:hypothetical protein